MWTWRQRTGELLRDGKIVATGYAGAGTGKNNPLDLSFSMPDRAELEATHNVGPIPRGRWQICAPVETHGGFALPLLPMPGTETLGRGHFLIHGDMADPRLRGTASLGCIILAREIRIAIWASGDHELEVVEGHPMDIA